MKPRFCIGIEVIDDPAWMGGTLYLRNLAISLASLPEPERPELCLLGSPDAVSRVLKESGNPAAFGKRPPNQLFRLSRLLNWASRSKGIDVVYPGFGTAPHGALVLRWIPDFQHRYLPQLFSAEEIEQREQAIRGIAERDSTVVVSSDVAKRDFEMFFPDHKATIRVWRFRSLIDTTAPPSRHAITKFDVPEKYLYVPNQFWAHKNHIVVLRALARLRALDLRIPLVCTGATSDRRKAEHFDQLQRFIEEYGLADQVSILGLIERREQIEVLRHAAAIIQPSIFEGWSTVVEDARAAGKKIFLSDIPVHREQYPPSAIYFDPQNDEELARILRREWGKLASGHDGIAETAARQSMGPLIVQSAREFCDIAEGALRRPAQKN
jgi:glycosyltransferase involved in cell wall biosynthesis